MAHGLPDYGINVAKAITYNLADLADLAVRMGSIVEYDRRGDVIYLDDCESPNRRFRESVSAGSSARHDSTSSRSGAQCCRLLTSGIIDAWAMAQYYIAPMVVGRHGVKISVALHDLTTRSSEYWIFGNILTGADLCEFNVVFNPFNRTISYRDEDGNDTVFEDSFRPFSSRVYNYHNIKLVVDLDTGYYVRLLFDTLEWDMSALRFYKLPNLAAPELQAGFSLEAKTAFAETVYQDDFIYTINEP